MKRFSFLPFFTGALLASALFLPPAHAKDKMWDDAVTTQDSVSVLDPAEEAYKIKQLAKLALSNEATDTNRKVLSEEIALIEKNKKLKENVVANLLNDDSPDTTLPRVELVKYKDGTPRGLLFIQTDNVRANNPNRLAWPLDPKRERKEQTK